MKINDVRQYGAISNYKRSNEAKSINTTNKKTARKDEVQISAEAKQLAQQLVSPMTSEERAETIKRLKEAIANNSYQVDSELVAERMINFFKTNSI
jgi:negative regulator of flagellin synthesis FlgM